MEAIVDFLFPPSCGACDAEGSGFCTLCRAASGRVQSWHCGTLPVAACGSYDGALRRAILAMKHGRRDVARSLGAFAAQCLAYARTPEVVLIPVPTTGVRRGQRGFDQAVLLARVIARSWNVACEEGLLRCAGRPQHGRTRRERLAGQHSLSWNGAAFSGTERVLLVDDVVTTGATLREAERALLVSGIHPAGAIVLARTPYEQ